MGAGSAGGGDARPPVLVLTGPTGAGKTDWAIALCEQAPIESAFKNSQAARLSGFFLRILPRRNAA